MYLIGFMGTEKDIIYTLSSHGLLSISVALRILIHTFSLISYYLDIFTMNKCEKTFFLFYWLNFEVLFFAELGTSLFSCLNLLSGYIGARFLAFL